MFRHLRVLLYEYNPKGCKRLERVLKSHVDALFVPDPRKTKLRDNSL